MTGKERLGIVVSLVLGTLATAGVWVYVRRIEAGVAARRAPRDVAVARVPIQPGERLAPDMVEYRPMPAEYVEWVRDVIHRSELPTYVDRRVVASVRPGQAILTHHIEGARTAAALEVREGTRAVTVFVNPVTGLAGMLRPGHYVDVLATFDSVPEGAAAGPQTSVLLDRVLVLAVGNLTDIGAGLAADADRALDGYSTVTLQVSPQDAELVTFAQTYGKLALVYRAAGDASTSRVPPVGFADVLRRAVK